MLGDIVVTSPHREVTSAVKKIGTELALNVNVLECALDDAVRSVKKVLSGNARPVGVIISRGATLRLLRQVIYSVPLVSIDTTEYDLVLALDQARTSGKKIGFLVSNPDNVGVIQKVSTILDVFVRVYIYTNYEDFHIQVEKAHRDGIDVLIGGGERGASLAQGKDIKHVSLLPSESTVRLALERAKDILETTWRVSENAERLKAILAHYHEGVMAVDENNYVSVFNPIASKIFGFNESEVMGRPLEDLSFQRSLIEIFEGFEERLGFIHKTRNAVLLVNKLPMVFNESYKGSVVTFKDVTKIQEEESKIRQETSAKGLVAKFSFDDLVHRSTQMAAVIAKARRFANTDCTVLIRGESGTGKELLAQSMHSGHLKRWNRPFVAVNCAALDDVLLKSELFGYEDGSFTGARKGGKPGLFELAHRGSLFLDEIGKVKLELQANLLRVLQEKEVRRIGSDRIIPVDVRIIAASNENLEDLISQGLFREDLYFRLNVLKLAIPPLRQRRDDIPDLVATMVNKFSAKYNKPIDSFPVAVLKKLALLDWPGNVRQLEHLIERCIILAENESSAPRVMMELIEEEFGSSAPSNIHSLQPDGEISVRLGTLQEMESEIIHKLALNGKTNKSELAMRLGISRPTLLKLLKNRG